MLNCTELIEEYKATVTEPIISSKKKRKYNCQISDITCSEVKQVGKKFKTNKKHVEKRMC
jgi:hypothetical protein